MAIDILRTSVHLLNQPSIKEGIKSLAGGITFSFGLIEIYHSCRRIAHCNEDKAKVACYERSHWIHTANKIIIACAHLSLILSAGVSRPGIWIISSLVGRVFSPAQIEAVWGPCTQFAVNPWHPRHIVSIAAAILALPYALQTAYQGARNAYLWFYQMEDKPTANSGFSLRLMTLFNTATSRPTLHLGNRFCRYLISHSP